MSTKYIGIDLHKSFFEVCAVGADGAKQWAGRWPTTPAGIAEFLGRCTADSSVALEASGPTWAFADQIVGRVPHLQVIDPRKTRLRAGYAAKTDRLDARRLADALRRDSVVRVYYPPLAIRQLRELCRYRATLVRMRTALKQRLHALVVRQGLAAPRVSDLFGVRGRQWLEMTHLDGWAGQSFAGLYALYQVTETHLEPVEATVRSVAHQDAVARALDQIPGVGAVLGLMIRAEVGDITRFPRAAQLASYAGLVPRVTQSGSKCYHGRITKDGSPWLRWALIEAAMHGTKRRDQIGRWARRLAIQKGALKARVAVARALCEEIHRTWSAMERLSGPAVETPLATPSGGRVL
jgi:transposase